MGDDTSRPSLEVSNYMLSQHWPSILTELYEFSTKKWPFVTKSYRLVMPKSEKLTIIVLNSYNFVKIDTYRPVVCSDVPNDSSEIKPQPLTMSGNWNKIRLPGVRWWAMCAWPVDNSAKFSNAHECNSWSAVHFKQLLVRYQSLPGHYYGLLVFTWN